MTLRTGRERAIQTAAYEAGGLLLAAPAYAWWWGERAGASLLMLVVLSGAVLVWAPLHNTVFDKIDWRVTGRTASARRTLGRVLHAVTLETTVLMVTCPLVMWLGGHTLRDALTVNLSLTLFYVGYAYVFHLLFDWLRPLRVQALDD